MSLAHDGKTGLSQLDSKTETHKHQVQNDGVIATDFLGVVQFSDELCLTIFIGSTYVICHETRQKGFPNILPTNACLRHLFLFPRGATKCNLVATRRATLLSCQLPPVVGSKKAYGLMN